MTYLILSISSSHQKTGIKHLFLVEIIMCTTVYDRIDSFSVSSMNSLYAAVQRRWCENKQNKTVDLICKSLLLWRALERKNEFHHKR